MHFFISVVFIHELLVYRLLLMFEILLLLYLWFRYLSLYRAPWSETISAFAATYRMWRFIKCQKLTLSALTYILNQFGLWILPQCSRIKERLLILLNLLFLKSRFPIYAACWVFKIVVVIRILNWFWSWVSLS